MKHPVHAHFPLLLYQEQEDRMKEELEAQLLSKESQLKEQLQAQKESLIREKERIEESLQETMAKALEEKDKKLQEEMMQTKQKLEMVGVIENSYLGDNTFVIE